MTKPAGARAAARLATLTRPASALLALSWAAGIFALSSLPGETLGGGGVVRTFLMNLAHAPLYVGLAALVGLAARGAAPIPFLDRARMLASFALVMLYAASDEWHQAAVPGREADALDLVTDAAGAWGGVAVAAAAVRCAAGGRLRARPFVGPALLAVAGAALATARGG